MKRKWWVLFVLATLVVTTFVSSSPVGAVSSKTANMPPNEGKIARALMDQGVIAPGASDDEIQAAVDAYLKLKLSTPNLAVLERNADNPDYKVLAKKQQGAIERNRNRADVAGLRGKKLGQRVDVEPAVPQEWTGDVKLDRILVLLVEFPDPEHNNLPQPDELNNADFWTSNFSREHYQDMLFTEGGYTTPEGLHLKSMTDYFLEQSGGSYTVTGDVYGWYMASQPESYYGDDWAGGGHDNNAPGVPQDLIDEVALAAAADGVPLWEYDTEDPYDVDGDGDLDEPDGIVDHLMVIHAGAGQEGGGGAQGNDSIWSHSSSTWCVACPEANVPYWGGTVVYNYTIMPEDGAIGVFCHEFGHDLGLPDEYDTIYSGESSVAFWSLMASGSWLGNPLGTEPAGISTWGRMVLGQTLGGRWVTPARLRYSDLTSAGTTFLLDQATTAGLNYPAVRVDLPPHQLLVNVPHGGSYEWFGGKGDEIDTTLYRSVDLTGASSATLDFWTWYNIEEFWDFGFVQASTDGGATWIPLVSPTMTDVIDPSGMESIAANLPGYTGSSGGWIHETIDLSGYAGQSILLQFRYMTDWATSLEGFFVDDITVTADGVTVFYDGAESFDPGWTSSGWTRDMGYSWKNHYYMLEWRNHSGFDTALGYCYNFVNAATSTVEWFSYDPGLLVWYRDTAYSDNWVGVHPGHGFLLVVDANPNPDIIKGVQGVPWRTRIQVRDAAFSLEPSSDAYLTYGGETHYYPGSPAQPIFSDARRYWSAKDADNSAIVTNYNVGFRVLGEAPDRSAALISVFLRK